MAAASRCPRGEQRALHDHILSQVEMIDLGRVPLSPSPQIRQTKEKTNQTKEMAKEMTKKRNSLTLPAPKRKRKETTPPAGQARLPCPSLPPSSPPGAPF